MEMGLFLIPRFMIDVDDDIGSARDSLRPYWVTCVQPILFHLRSASVCRDA